MNNQQCKRSELDFVQMYWRDLQPHVREAIMTLIDAALSAQETERDSLGEGDETPEMAASQACGSKSARDIAPKFTDG